MYCLKIWNEGAATEVAAGPRAKRQGFSEISNLSGSTYLRISGAVSVDDKCCGMKKETRKSLWTKGNDFVIIVVAGYADVAQLVEQPIRNQQVRGSSPLIGSSIEV